MESELDISVPENLISNLTDVLSQILKFKPQDRPDASVCLFHPYFTTLMNIMRDSNNDRRNCMICLEAYWLDEGVICEAGHFSCRSCFGGFVKSSSTDTIAVWKEREGNIICPHPLCKLAYRTESFLSCIGHEAFEVYMAKRLELQEAITSQELQADFQKRITMIENETVTGMHARKIQEDILNLKCPRCKAVFTSFEGCFALKCHLCNCAFCAWCLQDCGTDAHPHVAKCTHRKSDDVFYGPFELFVACHKHRKSTLVTLYLATVSEEFRADIVKSCRVVLAEIGFPLEDYLTAERVSP